MHSRAFESVVVLVVTWTDGYRSMRENASGMILRHRAEHNRQNSASRSKLALRRIALQVFKLIGEGG